VKNDCWWCFGGSFCRLLTSHLLGLSAEPRSATGNNPDPGAEFRRD